jgi:hypothetical protein
VLLILELGLNLSELMTHYIGGCMVRLSVTRKILAVLSDGKPKTHREIVKATALSENEFGAPPSFS